MIIKENRKGSFIMSFSVETQDEEILLTVPYLTLPFCVYCLSKIFSLLLAPQVVTFLMCFFTAPKRFPEFPQAKTPFPFEKAGGTLGNNSTWNLVLRCGWWLLNSGGHISWVLSLQTSVNWCSINLAKQVVDFVTQIHCVTNLYFIFCFNLKAKKKKATNMSGFFNKFSTIISLLIPHSSLS